ncbi:MAG: hypothetical protein ACI9EW_001806 [Cellvibrionaceae bacterium]
MDDKTGRGLASKQVVDSSRSDVSFGPRTETGKQGWDIFITLSETAKKLDVSFFDYVRDRVSQRFHLPSLADLIRQRSQLDLIQG